MGVKKVDMYPSNNCVISRDNAVYRSNSFKFERRGPLPPEAAAVPSQASVANQAVKNVPENYENVSTILKATGFPITLEDIDIRSVLFLYILLSFLSLLHDYILISPILSLVDLLEILN